MWDPEQIARDHGHAVITIEPTGDAGDLVDASEPGPVVTFTRRPPTRRGLAALRRQYAAVAADLAIASVSSSRRGRSS